ncbi:MAG: ABC transporter permease, partial [Candidatus Binatia bacterium]
MSNHTISLPQGLPATGALSRILDWLSRPVNLFFVVVAGILAYLSLFPTFFLFLGSFRDEPLGVAGTLTLTNYYEAYVEEPTETLGLLSNSLIFAFASATFSIFIAMTLAWIAIRTNAPFRGLFELTAILPNVVPALLVSMAWVFLLNPTRGMINVVLDNLFGIKPFNIYSMWGLIWVEGMVTAPLAFLIIAAALRSMDPALEESAKTLGSSEVGLTWRITFPLMRPAILAAWTLNFVRAIESFDTPAIIALPAGIEVFTTRIYREALESFPSNDNLAATYGVGLLLIALIFVYFYRRMTSRVERFTTVTGKGFRPHSIDLGKWKRLASGVALVMLFLMVVVPLLTLILISVLPYLHTPDWETFRTLTFKHWVDLYNQERVIKSIWA